jgi:uncharacterized membrane protein
MSLAPLLEASPVIQLHTAAALVAAAFGLTVLITPKGKGLHRYLGIGFVVFMAIAALTSFWITEIRDGRFSPIHLLSIVTLISLPLAIYYRRSGNIRGHARAMIGPLAGLIIAGGATLLPGRVLYHVVFC